MNEAETGPYNCAETVPRWVCDKCQFNFESLQPAAYRLGLCPICLSERLARARTLLLAAKLHIPFMGDGRAADSWHKDTAKFLREYYDRPENRP